jgi:rfaE bifunctional protein nucleotidyltransferase chain/domain
MPGNDLAAIVDLSTARRLCERARAEGRKVVLANGCFDILHVGHVRYLQGAKAAGGSRSFLVVGINGDRSVAALKGPGRPFLPAADRAELVAALQGVDLAVVFEEDTVASLIEALRPDLHCKGTDYTEESVPEREVVKRVGGATGIVGDPKDHSTRDLIERVRQRWDKR